MKSTNRRITFNEILLITGFPPWDDPSVLLATGIAKVHDAKLHIVHPLPSTMLQGTAWVREDSALATLWTDIVSRPSTRQTIIGLEEVGPRLRSLASRHDIDLVVVSTSSVSVSARRLIQDVFMEFECPIFMVGPEVETATYEPSTIVYATDFSPHAIAAAPFA